jgi:hypothetical protein
VLKAYRYVPALVVGAIVIAAAGPAFAAQARFYSYQRDYGGFDRRAYDNGYREGLEHGAEDVRRGRDFEYARHDDYRDADDSYSRSSGDKQTYRRIFRQGYVAGYTEGYRGFRGPRRSSWPGRSYSPAAQVGYRDGYAEGRDDAEDRDGYNPQRAKRYRDGDHDYDDRYGSRGQYRQEYRSAFLRGYEQGFREFGRAWDR